MERRDDETAGPLTAAGTAEMSDMQVTEVLNDLLTQARGIITSADQFVRTSPWQALALVTFAAVATGYMAGRRTPWRSS